MRGWGVFCSLLAHLFLLVVIIWTGSDNDFTVSGGSPGRASDGESGDGSYVQGLHYVQIGGAEGLRSTPSDAGEPEPPAILQSAVSSSLPLPSPSPSPSPLPPPETSARKSPLFKDPLEEKHKAQTEVAEVPGKSEVTGGPPEAKEGGGSTGSGSDRGGRMGSVGSESGSSSGSEGRGDGTAGNSPGGSGGTASDKYDARPTGVFLPPLPAPRKVQGFTLMALFEIDTLGRARLIRHNRSPDSDYNKRLIQLLRSLTFTTARSVNTNRPVIDTVLVTYTF